MPTIGWSRAGRERKPSGNGSGQRILKKLGVTLHPRRRGSCTSGTASSSWGTGSSAGRGRLGFRSRKIRSRVRGGAYTRIPAEVDPAFQGSDTVADQAEGPGQHPGTDRARLNPVIRGWGAILLWCPRPQALPPARSMDRATHLVAAIQEIAVPRGGNGCRSRQADGEYGTGRPG